jgi:hypothetical protein
VSDGRGIIVDITGDDSMLWSFWCQGCERSHWIGKGWTWDGNREAPTVSPSVLVRYPGPDAGTGDAPPAVCHLFIRAGRLEFLSDCTHKLAGQTVQMEPMP